MSYIGNTPGVSSQRVVTEEVISGSPKSAFYPIGGYALGYVDVLVNGLEVDSSDFTAADGVVVTLGTAAAVGDTVKIKCYLPRGLSDGYLKTEADARFLKLDGSNTLTGNIGLGAAPKSWGTGGYGFRAIDIGNYGAIAGWVTDTRKFVGIYCNAYLDSSSATIYKADGYASQYRMFNGVHYWGTSASGTAGTTASIPDLMSLDTGGNLALTSGNLNLGSATPYTAHLNLGGYNALGGTGYHTFMAVKNTYGSATNPSKYFRISSTGAFEIVNNAYTSQLLLLEDAGFLTVPGQVRVVLVGASGSYTAGTYTTWGGTAGNVLVNTGGGWNYTTKTFTAPVTGNYLVTAHIRMSSEGSSTYNYMQFENSNSTVNGTPIELWAPGVQSGGTYRPRQLTAVLRLNKNDTLNPRLYLNGTATLDGGSTGQADDYLNITLIN